VLVRAARAVLSHVGRCTNRMDGGHMWAMPALVAVATNERVFGESGQYGPARYHRWIMEHTECQVREQ